MALVDLTKTSNKKAKSFYQLVDEVKKLDIENSSKRRGNLLMHQSFIKVQSNSNKNKSVLLSDGTIVSFDSEGFGKVPAKAKAALDLEMVHKPNRYRVVVEDAQEPADLVLTSVDFEENDVELELKAALPLDAEVEESSKEEEVVETTVEIKPNKRGKHKK